ncbi:CDGSH iron-sulfur domain-containing protein [Aestuariivirga litoralis]|uniref:CDGSH iron-sulfur domain-containing protein n=1 Tax=Aestuariivirga litoralis TaxID=2650924 RepID=UPI0018C84255|nr:CDGSH iron-sulfur domain-containing protein [Aestuariivirga litoralis]MBG1231228.1 iron-binding protein [Aestuariivirga litoralis]
MSIEETVNGPNATIHFNARRCIHSRNCVLNRPDVFVPNVEGEWIHPENASATELVEIAHNCPSGAIRVTLPDGAALEQPPIVNTVRLRENGPLALNAEADVAGEKGLRFTLCRCGASRHKPFCDGSHTEEGFTASGEPAPKNFKALEMRNGPIIVDPTLDGPLHITGNLEVVTGTGKTINKVKDTWLCRCGHSANKPYCDGSHKAAGFKS